MGTDNLTLGSLFSFELMFADESPTLVLPYSLSYLPDRAVANGCLYPTDGHVFGKQKNMNNYRMLLKCDTVDIKCRKLKLLPLQNSYNLFCLPPLFVWVKLELA